MTVWHVIGNAAAWWAGISTVLTLAMGWCAGRVSKTSNQPGGEQ